MEQLLYQRMTKMAKHKINAWKLLKRLQEAGKYFTKKEYADIVERAQYLFEEGQFNSCEKELEKLPNYVQLLETLVEKLRGKSVHKTLRKLQEGKVSDDLLTAKGLSSLLTHVIIEIEKGNNEYKVLVPNILEKLSEISYNILQ